jgi:hypothetical protein
MYTAVASSIQRRENSKEEIAKKWKADPRPVLLHPIYITNPNKRKKQGTPATYPLSKWHWVAGLVPWTCGQKTAYGAIP